jgi:phage protein D
MPLTRKMMEPLAAVSKKDEREEDTLFLRLQDVAGAHADVYACTVQSTDGEFIVVLSDPDTGKEVCAWSGSADAVIVEFQH